MHLASIVFLIWRARMEITQSAPSSPIRKFASRWLYPLRFALILTIPLSLLDAVKIGTATGMPNLFAFWSLFVMYGILTVLDYLVGKDSSQPDADVRLVPLYKWIALATLPVQLAMLWWGLHVFTTTDFNWIGKLGWILSVGAVSGTIAITAAHELIHRPTRLEQWVGGILLSSVCYGGFKIEHIYGHHVNVSTPLDASSARYGQSVYAFVPQAVRHNVHNAWRLEMQRLRRRGLPAWRNELLVWNGLSAAFATAAWVAFGVAGLLFFIAQAIVAFCELEAINYVEHYGLARRKTEHGYERVAPVHSWNSSYRLINWYLLNLARHSDHHAHATRRYQELRHFPEAPQLPGGYGAMVLLALFPPLWYRVIHPRIPETVKQS
jgi:alkane 1-monooxygenase